MHAIVNTKVGAWIVVKKFGKNCERSLTQKQTKVDEVLYELPANSIIYNSDCLLQAV